MNKPIRAATLGDHFMVVYVIAGSPEGPCKIGFTNNLQRRLAGIQTGSWQPLTIYCFRMGLHPAGGANHLSLGKAIEAGSRELEKAAHRALGECDLKLHGEWFDVSVDDARSVLDKCSQLTGISALSLEQIAGAEIAPGTERSVAAVQMRLMKSLAPAALYVAEFQPYPIDRIV